MKKTLEYKIFNTVSIVVVTFFAILCLVPFLITLSGSFTSDVDLYKGISLFPRNPTLDTYRQVFENADALRIPMSRVTRKFILVLVIMSLEYSHRKVIPQM